MNTDTDQLSEASTKFTLKGWLLGGGEFSMHRTAAKTNLTPGCKHFCSRTKSSKRNEKIEQNTVKMKKQKRESKKITNEGNLQDVTHLLCDVRQEDAHNFQSDEPQ